MTQVCPKCGRQIKIDEASFCPYCAAALPSTPLSGLKRSGFPVSAGILAIIGSCAAAVSGFLGLYVYFWYLSTSYYYRYLEWFFTGFFGVVGFSLGLTAGIFALKRRLIPIVLVGSCLILLSGLITIGNFATIQSPGASMFGLLFGLPPAILGILSLIFAAVSHREFA